MALLNEAQLSELQQLTKDVRAEELKGELLFFLLKEAIKELGRESEAIIWKGDDGWHLNSDPTWIALRERDLNDIELSEEDFDIAIKALPRLTKSTKKDYSDYNKGLGQTFVYPLTFKKI